MAKHRWRWIAPALLLVVGLVGAGEAADRSKVDRATSRVEQGAKQIGRGELGPGFKEFFVGIGHTIVEGAVFSGRTIGEFFSRAFD
jgi:hypothetical protein